MRTTLVSSQGVMYYIIVNGQFFFGKRFEKYFVKKRNFEAYQVFFISLSSSPNTPKDFRLLKECIPA